MIRRQRLVLSTDYPWSLSSYRMKYINTNLSLVKELIPGLTEPEYVLSSFSSVSSCREETSGVQKSGSMTPP